MGREIPETEMLFVIIIKFDLFLQKTKIIIKFDIANPVYIGKVTRIFNGHIFLYHKYYIFV